MRHAEEARVKYWRSPLNGQRVVVPRGTVSVLEQRCKGCGFCVEYCPRDVLELSDKFNQKGYHPPVAVHPDGCVACGLCELICPEFAIHVTEDKEERL
jgi:2-oxoglutarate ferredoxin oxidoreductase subunit delta